MIRKRSASAAPGGDDGQRLALVLDLDGTLVDSAPDLMAALNVVLTGAGRPAVDLDAVKSMIGDGIAALVERGFIATGGLPGDDELERAVSRCLAYYDAHACDASLLFPGVGDTLGALRSAGHAMAICSNKPQSPAEQMLQHFGIAGYFECIVGGDTFAYRKPDPRMLQETLARVSVPANRAVMVGDSRNDLLVARGAGVAMIHATFGYGGDLRTDGAPDASIDSFDMLPAVLAGMSVAHR